MKYPVLLLLTFLLAYLQEQSLAAESGQQDCSCQQVPWQQSFDRAEHVVFGEVREVKKHSDDLAIGEFHAMETFKGDPGFVQKVVGSGKTGASCRRRLLPGFYIVFTNEEARNVVLNPCVASRKLEDDLVTTLSQVKDYANAGANPGQRQGASKAQEENADSKSWLQMLIDWID